MDAQYLFYYLLLPFFVGAIGGSILFLLARELYFLFSVRDFKIRHLLLGLANQFVKRFRGH